MNYDDDEAADIAARFQFSERARWKKQEQRRRRRLLLFWFGIAFLVAYVAVSLWQTLGGTN